MTTFTISALTVLIFIAALLYSSVGHAGASGYLAAMALLGIAPDVMKPTALVLNVLVATIATIKFYRAGCFSWSIFFPFAIASIPFSFVGGAITLPSHLYKPIVGLILLYAAYRLFRVNSTPTASEVKTIPLWLALVSGAGIGLLSGLTGTGGGIFLSPLLLFMGWAETRQTSGVSAAFILVNSIAGLLGQFSSIAILPSAIPIWAIAAIVGGFIGSEYGSKRLGNIMLRRLLAVVLVIAGLKMIFT
ncbi:MAG: sulfite exporter TauE/SafE family protein [Anaerolineales bacterium]|nr:MAG: sulfite exporter TauE/SafE family protein [Anaerolineales bacterium]